MIIIINHQRSQWSPKITIIMITNRSSVSLELRSTSASIKSTAFFFLFCICIVLSKLEHDFSDLFSVQNQCKSLQYKRNEFFLFKLCFLKRIY